VPLSKKKLQFFKDLLLERREQVLNRLQSAVSQKDTLSLATEELSDESDHASAMMQQSINVEQQVRNQLILKEIEHALAKFESGTFGYCEDTEEEIEIARLEAQPHTRYCVEAAEMREVNAKRYSKSG